MTFSEGEVIAACDCVCSKTSTRPRVLVGGAREAPKPSFSLSLPTCSTSSECDAQTSRLARGKRGRALLTVCIRNKRGHAFVFNMRFPLYGFLSFPAFRSSNITLAQTRSFSRTQSQEIVWSVYKQGPEGAGGGGCMERGRLTNQQRNNQ